MQNSSSEDAAARVCCTKDWRQQEEDSAATGMSAWAGRNLLGSSMATATTALAGTLSGIIVAAGLQVHELN